MSVFIHHGDCLEVMAGMEPASVNCVVTSPPYYGLRDYGVAGQIGLEPSPEEYVAKLVEVFREVRRVLRDDGSVWLNLGDSYGTGNSGRMASAHSGSMGNKVDRKQSAQDAPNKRAPTPGMHKQLLGIPWRVAFALQADGWWLRQDIIWHKPNPMPESVTDRCTKAHEYIFLLTKSERYWFDHEAIKEKSAGPGRICGPKNDASRKDGDRTGIVRGDGETRNRRSVWTVAPQPFKGAHFATFPPALVEPCILAGCPVGGMVLDPFGGSGTTAVVAHRLGRQATLIELNASYIDMIHARVNARRLPLIEAIS